MSSLSEKLSLASLEILTHPQNLRDQIQAVISEKLTDNKIDAKS